MTITLDRTESRTAYVRPLLPRTGQYVVSTLTLGAYVANQIVREQMDHSVMQTVEWTLAMHNVVPVAGGSLPRPLADIAGEIDDLIEDRVGDEDIELHDAQDIVTKALTSVYGRQVKISGWMPGHRVAEGRTVLELSGDTCPNCVQNPTGFRVGDYTNTARCLNSEDCGWTNA